MSAYGQMQGQALPPMRENGLQMRLSHIQKGIAEAHSILSRVEQTIGGGNSLGGGIAEKPAAGLDGLIASLNADVAQLVERLARLESQF